MVSEALINTILHRVEDRKLIGFKTGLKLVSYFSRLWEKAFKYYMAS